MDQISIDATSLLFTLAVSFAAGIAFGAVPVLKQARTRLAEALHAGGRNSSAGRDRNFARNALTVVQVALALVLLIGSGLMIRTFQSIRRVQPGFTGPESVQALRISIPRDTAPDEPSVRALHRRVADRLAAIPGASSVGLLNGLPMTGFQSQDPIFASDRTYRPSEIPKLRRFITVAPGAFRTMGTPIQAGREYNWTDIQEGRRVVIIAENFAREYWGSAQAAVGKQIRQNPNDPWSEVIGVAGDIRYDGSDKPAPSTVYWPLRSNSGMEYLIRSPRAGSESFATEIRQAVAAANATLTINDMRTMKQIYDRSMARTAFTLTLLAISGGMALLLAAIGIYAVVSYAVAQRTREIGIRMALGAQQGGLKLMFVRQGLVWGGIGAAAGLAASAALSRVMSALLFEIDPVDPLTYSVVAIGLLAAAAMASYLPARRITRVDPIEALRAE